MTKYEKKPQVIKETKQTIEAVLVLNPTYAANALGSHADPCYVVMDKHGSVIEVLSKKEFSAQYKPAKKKAKKAAA